MFFVLIGSLSSDDGDFEDDVLLKINWYFISEFDYFMLGILWNYDGNGMLLSGMECY